MSPTTDNRSYREHSAPVAILGGGMVGCTAALLLAQQGIRCLLIEQLPFDAVGVPKSGRVDSETVRIWEQLGLGELLQPLLHPLQGIQIAKSDGKVLFEFASHSDYHHAPYYSFHQPDVHKVLLQALRQQKQVSLWDEMSIEAVEPMPDHVLLYTRETVTGEYHRFAVPYLWVCAGQTDVLAAELGLEWESFYHGGAMHYRYESVTQPQPARAFAQIVLSDSAAVDPMTIIPVGEQHRRVEELLDPSNFLRKTQATSSDTQQNTTSWLYRFDAKMLKQWHQGRIFFLGDAAHILPPYLGMGLSEGIKDAYNLAWKLLLHTEGQCTDAVWESYYLEREASIRYLVRLNIWVDRFVRSKWFRWLRWVVPILPKRWLQRRLHTNTWIQKGLVGEQYAQWGRWFPDFWVRTLEQKTVSLDSQLGRGFVVLAWDTNPVDDLKPDHIEFLAGLNTQFIRILPGKARPATLPNRFIAYLYDEEGAIEKWLTREQRRWWILRPDRVIYDAAETPAQLQAIMDAFMQQFPAVGRGE